MKYKHAKYNAYIDVKVYELYFLRLVGVMFHT